MVTNPIAPSSGVLPKYPPLMLDKGESKYHHSAPVVSSAHKNQGQSVEFLQGPLGAVPSTKAALTYLGHRSQPKFNGASSDPALPPRPTLDEIYRSIRPSYHIIGTPTASEKNEILNRWNQIVYEVITRPRPKVDGTVEAWLNPQATQYKVVNREDLLMAASHHGFPEHYPHWSYGQEFEKMYQLNKHNMSKLYELVINTNPSIAYMLDLNSAFEHAIVMAHVYGHTDFFKNNVNFEDTNPEGALSMMRFHRDIVNNHIRSFGLENVEQFLDKAHTMQWLIDMSAHSKPAVNKHELFQEQLDREGAPPMETGDKTHLAGVLPRSIWETDPDEKARRRQEYQEDIQARRHQVPYVPDRDVLGFILEFGRGMADWQKDLLSVVRDEGYYFAPQLRTKIMNEGWATFWHEKLTGEKSEVHDMAKERQLAPIPKIEANEMKLGVLGASPNSINPYALGLAIFKDIERVANEKAKKDGKTFNEHEDHTPGIEAVKEVRRKYDDVSFIDNFLSDRVCKEQQLYTYDPEIRYGWGTTSVEDIISSRETEEVRQRIISMYFNGAQPLLEVVDGNFNNNRELLLRHEYMWDLRIDWAKDILRFMSEMWGGPVHIDTYWSDEDDPEEKTPIRISTTMKNVQEGRVTRSVVDKVDVWLLDEIGGKAMKKFDTNPSQPPQPKPYW